MDYAAALRAAPTGPAVKLDTTPAAKQVAKPVSKPAKVVEVEPTPVIEEEAVPSVNVAQAPAKPPTNAGLSPVVRFVINVPHSASSAKDKESTSTENNADESDSSDNADEEASGDATANGAKSNASKEGKAHNFSAQDLENVRTTFQLIFTILSTLIWAYHPSLDMTIAFFVSLRLFFTPMLLQWGHRLLSKPWQHSPSSAQSISHWLSYLVLLRFQWKKSKRSKNGPSTCPSTFLSPLLFRPQYSYLVLFCAFIHLLTSLLLLSAYHTMCWQCCGSQSIQQCGNMFDSG